MSRLMRAHDWTTSSLGPPDRWPNALKVAVRLMLTSRFDMWLGWGPDLAFLYNDAYRPTLGDKHPRSLAMPTRELWPEIWADVGPKLRAVYEHGQSTWDRGLLLLLNRHGYVEETYHTFSYSPLMGDAGCVEGVFCAVSEETDRVISERRLASLNALASLASTADTRAAVLDAARKALAMNPHDLPFTLTYLFDDAGQARLSAMTGIDAGHPLAGRIESDVAHWGVNAFWRGAGERVIDATSERGLPTGAWQIPPVKVALMPVMGQGTEHALGALVVGLNPYRAVDDGYLGFIRLVSGQLASRLSGADVHEAGQRRAVALAEALRMRHDAAEALRSINAQLQTEVEARTAERDRLRNLFQQAPSFMCLLDGPQLVFSFVNEAYAQVVGHRDLIGLPIRQALPEIEGQGFFELLDQVFETGQAFVGTNMKAQLQRTRGGPLEDRFLHLVYQPVLDRDGSVSGIFVDGYDVTAQKQAEDDLQNLNGTLEKRVEQRTEELARAIESLRRESAERESAQVALRQVQRMESIGALSGGIAHDFNNLLQVIGANLQLLLRYVAGNERAEARVRNGLSGVARGARLASQLLAFGRRQPLEPKIVNVGRFIKTMDDMLRRALGEEIELETVISGGLWNTLIDPGQIESAILNLAINARDAMNGQGKLTIEASNAMLDDAYVRQHEDLTAGQYVLVAVTDSGAGIEPAALERVFEPFFSTKPEGKGTGLGLSMVYGFVKQSGGHIKIYSELGEGTTVKLYLPRATAVEDILESNAPEEPVGGRETILVVEDDDDVREAAVATLIELGYRTLKARDAASALNVIESGVHVDLLFTDVVMPGSLRSPELARKARERLPGVAVLFTSGYTENAIVHGGRLDSGVELLSKPYSREALAQKIRHVLNSGGAMRSPRAPLPRRESPFPAATMTLTVLLVEDDEEVRGATAEILAGEGHAVIQAATAGAALEALRASKVDVLLTDINLPDLPGTELAQRAAAEWPDVALVFAAGEPPATAMAHATVVLKPYDAAALLDALHRSYVSMKQLAR